MRDSQIRRIEDCFQFIRNGANIKQEKGASGIPITRIETLSGGVFNRDRLGYANIFTVGKFSSYVLETGDLLLSHINSKAYIGRTVLYKKEGEETIIHGMNLLRLKVIPNVLLPKYFYYYTLTDGFKSQVSAFRKDAVNQSSISVTDIKKIEIPVPSIEEQLRIVTELDLVSSIIEKRNTQLAIFDKLAQAVFYERFGDPIANERGWEKRCLKDVGKVITGGTPSTKDLANYSSNDICFFKPSDIAKDSVTNLDSSEYYISSYAFENARKLPAGSVLTTCIGIVGKVGILKCAATCNQQINAVIPQKVNSVFLAYAIYLQKSLLENMANAPVVPIINKGAFSEFMIPVPSIHEQEAFASDIESIERMRSLAYLSIIEAEKLLSSRMDYYFSK